MNEEIKLNNGLSMPRKAFGTWHLHGREKIEIILREAISVGFRHFDFALTYENEKEIGRALKIIFDSGLVRREDLFLTGKLWNTWHDHVDRAIETTLSDLQLTYLDLYLIHWPVHAKPDENMQSFVKDNLVVQNEFDLNKLWPRMESLVQKGLVRSIGVANFGIENIKKVLKIANIKPVCNQIELHPFLQQKDLVKVCQKQNIAISCYSPLRSLEDLDPKGFGKEILEIAQKHNVSPSTIIISFLYQKGFVVITKTQTKERVGKNFITIELSDEDITQIENISETKRYIDFVSFGENRFK